MFGVEIIGSKMFTLLYLVCGRWGCSGGGLSQDGRGERLIGYYASQEVYDRKLEELLEHLGKPYAMRDIGEG